MFVRSQRAEGEAIIRNRITGCCMTAHHLTNIRRAPAPPCKTPLPQDARRKTLERAAPPRQGLATGILDAADADSTRPSGSHHRVIAILLVAFSSRTSLYHVLRKPTELFVVAGHRFDKDPAETWRQYGPLFRSYATGTITPELLAALAQTESSGNPVARTYWRWRLSFNPFSDLSARLQRGRPVPDDRSRFRGGRARTVSATTPSSYRLRLRAPVFRAIPSHAVELASVYLDRHVAAVLARARCRSRKPAAEAGSGRLHPSLRRRPGHRFRAPQFQMAADERCGDHSVAAYVARVNAMKRQFLRLTGGKIAAVQQRGSGLMTGRFVNALVIFLPAFSRSPSAARHNVRHQRERTRRPHPFLRGADRNLDTELQEINEQKKEVFAEAKGEGFDVKILKEIIKLRKQDQDDRDEHETLLDIYMRAMETAEKEADAGEPRAKAA